MDALFPTIPGVSTMPLVNNKIRVPGSNLSFSAACFGGFNDRDWSLGPLQWPEDAKKYPELAERVGVALYSLGAKTAYAPNPTQFNAQVIASELLNREIMLPVGPERIPLLRNQALPADGSFLYQGGEAGIFSAGGCSVIALTYGSTILFAHAGRDCVLDRHLVATLGTQPSRPYESVVYAMLAALGVPRSRMEHVHAWVLYSIKPEHFLHPFNHPEHGRWNVCASEYIRKHFGARAGRVKKDGVEIDVPEIAKRQFMLLGVPESNIHLDHAYLEDELPTTRNGGGRYLVAIVRH